MQPALHAQPRQPVLTVGGTAGHGAQQLAVDLDHLLDCLGCDPVAGSGAGVCGDDDAALEAEGEGGSSVSDLDRALRVGAVVRYGAEPGGGLRQEESVDCPFVEWLLAASWGSAAGR